MPKISIYSFASPPTLVDYVIGTKDGTDKTTKNFRISDVLALVGSNFTTYEDNSAALAGGLNVGNLYKTSTGEVRIVI